MSSLVRRLQIRQLKKSGARKLPVISAAGFIVGTRWPQRKGDLAFLPTGEALRADSKHPTLQPVIEALAAGVARREDTPAAA